MLRPPLLGAALLLSGVAAATPVLPANGSTAVCQAPEAVQTPLRSTRQWTPRSSLRGGLVLDAEKLEAQLGKGLQAQGDVRMRRGETVLRAPALNYDETRDEVRVPGQVELEHQGNSLRGKGLRLEIDKFLGELLEPTFRLALTGGSGTAERIDFLGEERLRASRTRYSSCPPAQGGQAPDWELHAQQLDFDLPANEGRAKGAVLHFLGTPILAAPEFSFPLTDERKSGWLPPHFTADNRSGIEVAVPYYFNLAPDRDLTLTPFVMTRRGFGADAELRALQPWGQGQLNLSLLPHDRVLGEKRWIWQAAGEANPWSSMRLKLQTESASDHEIWKDLRRRIDSPTPRLLVRDLHAEQTLDGWGLNGSLYARALGWQVLQTVDGGEPVTAPYQREPQVGMRLRSRAELPLLGGFLPAGQRPALEGGVELEFNRFSLPAAAAVGQDPGGQRVHALAHVALPVITTASWLVPKLSVNAAHYRTQQAMSDGRSSARRVIPSFSVDTGMVFERDTQLLGRSLLQTLEPRLLFVATPYRPQETLPQYDSAALDFNVESLYASNAFSGVDRVSDARQLSFGATSRWLNPVDGEEVLRLGLVQRYQFRPQRITADPGSVNRRFSDLLLAGAAHLSSRWWLDAALQVNPDTDRTERSVLRARYTADDFRTVSLAYRLKRQQSEQLDLAWQWPLTRQRGQGDCAGRWFGAGRVQYSLQDSRVTDSLLGVEYNAGCWVLRMGVERLSTGREQANTRFLVQLELVGLSRLGSNALSVLRENVPGYRPVAGPSGP